MHSPAIHDASAESKHWKLGIWTVLAVAAILRVVLVLKGGQFAFFDESRYNDSLEGATQIASGHFFAGLALPLEKGDHVGFKEIGLVPALIEHHFGRHNWIPGLYFASFSLVAIALLGGIAGRFGVSRRGQFWAVLAGAASASLFYLSRHLFPYDVSLCFALAAVYLGLAPAETWRGLVLAGFVAGSGFVIYYGYWTLAGVSLVFLTFAGNAGPGIGFWKSAVRRGLFLGAGLVLSLALPVAVNHLWGTGKMIEGARTFSGTITQGDFDGIRGPWEYLWYCDHLELLLALGLTVAGLILRARPLNSETFRWWRDPQVWNALCLFAIWLLFVVTGNLLHKFSVYDRLIRQMLPFLVLGFAFGLEQVLGHVRSASARATLAGVAVAVLLVNAALSFAVPLQQEFPADFERRASAILAARHEPDSPDFYYRFVNVTQYIFEPEVLPETPLETLAEGRHIYQYRPFLFSGGSREARERRLAVDHRMRLVKMPISPNSRIQGDRFGTVTIKLRLPTGRAGFAEPLLTMGPRNGADALYLRYLSDKLLTLGFFSLGNAVYDSQPIDVEAGSEHVVELRCGDLMPPSSSPDERRRLTIKIDGKVAIDAAIVPKDAQPEQVYAGVRATLLDYTTGSFSGKIESVVRQAELVAPGVGSNLVIPSLPSKIRLTLLVGRIPLGEEEPLAVAGESGNAASVWIRRVSDRTVALGVEFWGVSAWETPALDCNPIGSDQVEFELGPLFPAVDSASWGRLAADYRKQVADTVLLRWNGKVVLYQLTPSYSIARPTVVLGRNPIGGSAVKPAFQGLILKADTIPLGTEEDPDRQTPPAN